MDTEKPEPQEEHEAASPDNLVARLKLELQHYNMLVGCTRRHMWTHVSEEPWYAIKGNAYLRVLATQQIVSTPVGTIGVWWYDSTIMDFRGGPMKTWWVTDLYEIWVLTKEYSGLNLRPYAYLLQENKGQLFGHTVSLAELKKPDAGEIIRRGEVEPWGRLAKNTERAYHTCRTCPVKRQCDTTDKVTPQGTADWGSSYPIP